ncbi:TetR family transcriptional regulator [Streptomyces sp. NPDC003042]
MPAAAEQLFTECDPRALTTDRIAKAAGVGRATLYHRFPDPASISAVEHLERHLPLTLGTTAGQDRFAGAAYRYWARARGVLPPDRMG